MALQTVTIFRGGEFDSESRWFTTDAKHAAGFGDVQRFELTYSTKTVMHVDGESDERLAGCSGWDADEALYEIAREARAEFMDWLRISHWEGHGDCWLSLAELDESDFDAIEQVA